MYYQTITAKNPRHIYKEEDAEPYVSLLSFGSSRHTNVDTHYDNARSRRGVTRRRNVKPSMLSMLRHHASCQTTYVPPYRSHIDTVAHLDVRIPVITAVSTGRSVVGSSSHPKACLELSTDEWHGRHRFSVPKLLALAEMTGCTAQQVKVFTRLDALFNADSALASWCDKRCVCSIVVPESAADGFTCVRLHLTWNRLELFRRFMAFEGAVMTQVLMRFGRRITAEMISDMLQDAVFRTVQAATPWTSDHLLQTCRSTHLQVVPMVKAVLEHDDRDDCYEDVIQCMNVDVAAGVPSLPSVRVVHAVMTAMMHVDIKPYQLATTAWALDHEKHDASCLDAFSFAVYDSTTHAYVGRVFFGARIGRAASSVLTFRCVEAGHAACTGVGDTDTDTDIDTDDAAQLLQTRIRGGFIVEDMGMGKTVEVLALILASKQQAVANANANAAVIHIDDAADEDMTETDDTANEAIIHTDDTADEAEVVIHTDDMADAAEVIRTLRNCGTTGMHIRYSGRWQWHYERESESEQQQRTLVVVPLTLAEQWMNEIDTRVRDARVALPSILYHGPSRHRTSAAKLHRYDVVVTTYETLTCDVSAMRGPLAAADTTWQCPHVLYFVPDEETSTSRPFQCYDVLQTQMENARFMMYIDADTAVCLRDWEGSSHGSHFGSIGDRVAVPRHATRLGRGFQCTAEHVATCHVCPVCGHDATLALSAFFTSHPRTPLEAIPWTRVVFDESHRIATTNTRLFAALSALQTECRWFLTGTPAPKDLPSLRAQLQLLGVGPVGRCITTPMAVAYARTSESIGVHALTQQTALNGVLLRWLADLMVRHTKSDFVADVAIDTSTTMLHEDTVFVTLADADMREYRVARDATRARFAAIRDREQPWDVTEVLSLIAHERELCTLTTRRKTTQRAETRRRLVAERADARRGAHAGDVQDASLHLHLQLPDIPAGAHRADEECPICMELMAHAVVLPCMHCFCHECLAIVLSTVPAKCSLCQARLSTPAVLQLRLACEAVRRATIIPTTGTTDEDEATTATAAGATAVTVDDADVAVHYAMVKYDALLTYVQRQARQTLVFTHFEDVVQMLLPALRRDGVPACAVTGSMTRQARARAIADFNAGWSRVLVLSLRTAGVGLNLTTAQHVVFMEPCLNRALERQAVGRVHRIGLVHDVTVTHIVARGTIEERVRRYENVQQEFDTDVATEELRTVVVRDEARRISWRRAQLQALIGAPA